MAEIDSGAMFLMPEIHKGKELIDERWPRRRSESLERRRCFRVLGPAIDWAGLEKDGAPLKLGRQSKRGDFS